MFKSMEKLKITFTFFAILILSSCMKRRYPIPPSISETRTNLSVQKNGTINFGLVSIYPFDDNDNAVITTQANNFGESFLKRTLINTQYNHYKVDYQYTPRLDFTGSDEVIIKSEHRNSDGSVSDLHYTIIKIVVVP